MGARFRSRLASTLVALVPIACGAIAACDVPIDDTRSDNRQVTPVGVIRGSISYSGPGPCSQDGHIVGTAVVLLFAFDDLPPPEGTASTALNFATVPGDVLFADEPRSPSSTIYCPVEHGDITTRTVTAPFTLSPTAAGVYAIQSFYSAHGTFLPEFTIRSTPIAGDVVGGVIDAAKAAPFAGDPYYLPAFLPVAVGVPTADDASTLIIPPSGFLRDNVPVRLGSTLTTAPPYFSPIGAESGDPATPILRLSQDLHVLAPPTAMTLTAANAFQASFPNLSLRFGLPAAEAADGTDPSQPFDLSYKATDGFVLASRGYPIPEGGLADLWPLVVLTKLADEADGSDPQELRAQGDDLLPRVILQGITLEDGSVGVTALAPPSTTPNPNATANSLTALVRPSVVCIDPRSPEKGGVLATPYLTGKRADDQQGPDVPLFDPKALVSGSGGLVREVVQGCLPTGRYAIHVIGSTGQAWTTPNEAGSCAAAEGAPTDTSSDPEMCSLKSRAVLLSQGPRAVVEITAATTAAGKSLCASQPVPAACLQNPQ